MQQRELERQARRLREQADELETQNDALLAIAETLREETEAGEAARVEAERAQAEAQRADAAKTRFLAAMSHEWTPLNAIQGYAELLDRELQGPLTEGQRDYLARLSSSGRHLLALIDDLLDLGRIDAGQVELQATSRNDRRDLRNRRRRRRPGVECQARDALASAARWRSTHCLCRP